MKQLLVPIVLAVMAIAGCSTDYYAYQGAPVMVGTGGAAKNINGVDLWLTGSPPRKYQIIGYITDGRPGGPIPMAQRDSAVAAAAKAKGGDAVIMNSDNEQFRGAMNLTSVNSVYNSAFINSTTVPITRRESTFLVIKYL